MKSHKENEGTPMADSRVGEFEETVSGLLTAIVDHEVESRQHEKEAFDIYVHGVRSKLHRDMPLFRAKFAKGYQALIEELKHEHA